MSRNTIIAVTIAAIIILGAAAAILYSQTKPSTNEIADTPIATEVEPQNNGMMLSTIADVFSKGDNAMCTFNVETEEGGTAGRVYVSEDNARGEFVTTVDDDTFNTYMVRNDDTFYMWGDSLPTGIKMVMSINEWASQINDPDQDVSSSFDPNEQVDFKCTAWSVDSSLFEAPTDIKFITFEGSFGPSGTTLTDPSSTNDSNETGTETQCNICNALTGEAKNICLEQFNCQQ